MSKYDDKKFREKLNKDNLFEKIQKEKDDFKRNKHLIKPVLVITLLIIIQIGLFIYLYNRFVANVNTLNNLITILRVVLIVYILNLDRPIDYKVAWIIPIAALPLFGIALYILLEISPGPKRLKRRIKSIKEINSRQMVQDYRISQELMSYANLEYGLDRYLYHIAGYPMYKNTKIEYFTQGEDYFYSLMEDIKNAKEFILIEFFIIREGKLLDSLLDLLELKMYDGVEVRFMYDGMNDYHIPSDYKNYLKARGFDVTIFAPVYPVLSTYHNNRDHRKIVSIDNKIAYTGGLNLADEYINEIERFGHWKDNGIRLEGEAVKNFTYMFFNLWDLANGSGYKLDNYLLNQHSVEDNSFVQPFGDSPNDNETVGENVYVDVLNQAKDYVYIMTPYLILSDKIRNALNFASKRGVDVRVMMPGIADKKIPYCMSRSYYENLLECGTRVFEYRPGFLHSKSFVSDDMTSVVGTINLDFRSLHLHYENGVLIYDEDFSATVKDDFLITQDKCQEITMQVYKDMNFFYRMAGKLLRIFAPLM